MRSIDLFDSVSVISLRRSRRFRDRFINWIVALPQRFWIAAMLLAVAVALHFWCCQWKLPRVQWSSTNREYVWKPYDNQLVGFINASARFRNGIDADGAQYDLGGAAAWGLHVPMLMLSVALVLFLSLCTPKSVRKVARQLQPAFFERWGLKTVLASCVIFLMVVDTASSAASQWIVSVSKNNDSALADSGAPCSLTTYIFGVQSSGGAPSASSSSGSDRSSWFSSSDRPAYTSGEGTNSVPEPSTYAMLGAGAISLLVFAWRKRC